MSRHQKFMFDLDFGDPDEPEEPEVAEDEADDEPEEIVPTFSEEELEAAKQQAFDEGKEAGRAQAAEATEQRVLETMEKVEGQLTEVIDAQFAANHEIAGEMIRIATAIAKKMFPDLNERNALGEVERVVQETLKAINDEPRVQIFVHPELREAFAERLTVMTHRAGFEGKVFVNPEPTFEIGDCRVEWSNGSAIRNTAEIKKQIDDIIERNLHGLPDDFVEQEMAENSDSEETAETSAAGATEEQASDHRVDDAPSEPEPPVEMNTSEPEAVNATGDQTIAEPETESAVGESELENPSMDDAQPQEMVDGTEPEQETEVDDLPPPSAEENQNFAPSSAPDDAFEPEETVEKQEDTEFVAEPPIPDQSSLDEGRANDAETSDDENMAPMHEPPTPTMSQETTAAILEEQGRDDEDDATKT